jgi:hypothetical protein
MPEPNRYREEILAVQCGDSHGRTSDRTAGYAGDEPTGRPHRCLTMSCLHCYVQQPACGRCSPTLEDKTVRLCGTPPEAEHLQTVPFCEVENRIRRARVRIGVGVPGRGRRGAAARRSCSYYPPASEI